MSVWIWWHELSNFLDIVYPNGLVWRYADINWRRFKLNPGDFHGDSAGWYLIGEFK